MHPLTNLAEIVAAREALPDFVRHTPMLPLARTAGEVGGERLWLKCENLQVTGAYKIRAAFTVLDLLDEGARRRGVVVTSSGNFAQAYGYAGARLGVPVVVVMLEGTSAYKVEEARGYGAEVVFCGTDALGRQAAVERLATERGMLAVDNWEYPPIIAGHGSIGLEILEDLAGVEAVLVPVSSGGVAAGVATAIKLSRPEVRVVGVQPAGANAAYLSLRAGQPVAIEHWDSMADGLSARRPGEYPFRHLQTHLDDLVLVSEEDIARAFRTLIFRAKVLSEPAGAVAAAAYLGGHVDPALQTVAVVTGGNVTESLAERMLAMSAC